MKKQLIIGLGKSGKAAVEYFEEKKIAYRIIDRADGSDQGEPALEDIEQVIKSPGVLPSHPWVRAAQKRGIPVMGEIDLAIKELKGKTLLAVTGSNGKTTTCMATAHVLGKRAKLAGNCGIPLLSCIHEAVEIFVVEVSSAQLDTIQVGPHFHAAALLNITPNHLDYHPTFEEYARAKWRLKECVKEVGRFYTQKDLATFFPNEYRDGEAAHDRENFAAAFALCSSVGVTRQEFEDKIKSFVKPPHRLQWVANIQGVEYINDSKSTSVDATIKGVSSVKKPLYVIVGGVDKGGDFASWIPFFLGKVRHVFALGPAAERIQKELAGSLAISYENSLEESLEKAKERAKEGEAVLLSPGCSSFDRYKNFEERGEHFTKLVLAWGKK